MKILGHPSELDVADTPLVVTIGAFDGVHRGHQALIHAAAEEARRLSGESWMLTFEPHPLRVIHPERAPRLLSSREHRCALLEAAPVDGCILMPFTRDIAAWEPEYFVEWLIDHVGTLKTVVVGSNWRFGRDGRGDVALLHDLCTAHGVTALVLPPVLWQGKPISSTRVRAVVEEGDMDAAEAMLGRPYSVMGTVAAGQQAGRALGFPTANITPDNESRPPAGVYAGYTVLDGLPHNSVAYLRGPLTAKDEAELDVVEVHLLDFERDLYGSCLEVFFLERLRGDERFGSREEAVTQIEADIRGARAILEKRAGTAAAQADSAAPQSATEGGNG